VEDFEVKHIIDGFISAYAQNDKPIRMNFRKLVPNLNNSDRYSHLIHPYPAKLISNIPYFFLQTDYFCPTNGVVLDPFCGTGTVMLEANISGRNAKGADSNPLAVLISQVKTTYIGRECLQKTLESVVSKAKRNKVYRKFDIASISHWFSPSTIQQLSQLEEVVENIQDKSNQQFFKLCLSSLIRKVSYADPSISVPVRLNPKRFDKNPERQIRTLFRIQTLENIDVYDKFYSICQLNINRIDSLKNVLKNGITSDIISNDARRLTTSLGGKAVLDNECIDLILTSPPYAGAQKYIRSSWLNLYWLGTKLSKDIRILKQQNIGREDYHKVDICKIKTGIDAADKVLESLYLDNKYERAFIVGNYLNEMKDAIDESIRVLKANGYMIIIIGNNTVCGRPFDTQDYLTTYILSKGLKLQFKLIDDIKSYGLMTKRNKTASMISCEWVLVFKK
jgi:DNA modification methylase